MSYEYKVVPAPVRGLKAKGMKTPQERFAHALETEMNSYAADGWEYLRADTLPSEQREGLLGKATVFQNILVFRRAVRAKATQPAPVIPAAQPQLTAKPTDPQLMLEKSAAPDAPETPPSRPATDDK